MLCSLYLLVVLFASLQHGSTVDDKLENLTNSHHLNLLWNRKSAIALSLQKGKADSSFEKSNGLYPFSNPNRFRRSAGNSMSHIRPHLTKTSTKRNISERERLRKIEVDEIWDESFNINERDTADYGNTVLHVAVTKNYPTIVEFFLNKGADSSIKNNFNKTPLMVAQAMNPRNEKIVQLLLQAQSLTSTGSTQPSISEECRAPPKRQKDLSGTINVGKDVLNLLNQCEENLLLSEKEEIILVLGNTGSGKTTLTQKLAGNSNTLKSVMVSGTNFIIIDDKDKIGTDLTVSKTLIPELVVLDKTNSLFYDCPGFSDTRSTSHDITANYCIKKVIDYSQKVKLLFTVIHSAVSQGKERHEFLKLVKHAVRFVRNIKKFENSIALVVTKVNSYVGTSFLHDDTILNSIIEYISIVKAELLEKIRTINLVEERLLHEKMVQFIDILLTKDSTTHKYTKIGISRSPDKCGVLSTVELVMSGIPDLENLYSQRIDYTEKNDYDFGYSLSDKSKLDIELVVTEINANITSWSKKIADNSKDYFKRKVEKGNIYNFYLELDMVHKNLSGEFQILKSNSELTPEKFSKGINDIFQALKIQVSRNYYLYISRLGKYLSFLENAARKSFKQGILQWIKPLDDFVIYIGNLKMWYGYLEEAFRHLSQYSVQRNFKSTNRAFVMPKFHTGKVLSFYSGSPFLAVLKDVKNYNGILNVPIDQIKYNELKSVLDFVFNRTIDIVCDPKKGLIVKGNFLYISDIRSNYFNCPYYKTFLGVFSLDTVFIDTDFSGLGQKLNMSIMSPKWCIVGDRKINLDGVDGKEHNPPTAGQASNGNGLDGKPGNPGGNGGNFFGLGLDLDNAENLQISAHGGKGGPGMHGGGGRNGYHGRTFNVNEIDLEPEENRGTYKGYSFLSLPKDGFNQEFLDKYNIGSKTSRIYFIEGSPGTKGNNGGNGGKGGFGGRNGEIKIIVISENKLSDISYMRKSDADKLGKAGEGGLGGEGGQSGNTIVAKNVNCPTTVYGVCLGNDKLKYIKTIYESPAARGVTGMRNYTDKDQKTPEPSATAKYSEVISEYKYFLLEYGSGKGFFDAFIDKLESNDKVKKLTSTISLYEDLMNYEKIFGGLGNPEINFHYYKSLLQRILEYSKDISAEERTAKDQYIRVLSSLYTTAYGRIYSLKRPLGSGLVTNVKEYFNFVKENIISLENTEKTLVMANCASKYKIEIDQKISQGIQFIHSSIIPEVNLIGEELERNSELLLSETLDFLNKAENEKVVLESELTKFQKNAGLRYIFSALRVVTQVMTFAGPQAAVVAGVIGAGTSVAESFILDDNTRAGKPFTMPSAVTNWKNSADSAYKDLIQNDIKETNTVIAAGKGLLGIEYVQAKRERLETSLGEQIQNSGGGPSGPDTQEVSKLKKEINSVVIEILEDAKKKKQESKTEQQNSGLHKINEVKNTVEMVYDVYRKHKIDDSNINEIEKEIEKADEKIQSLKNFERNIYSAVGPMLTKIKENVDSTARSLDEKSQISLDVSKWKVQSMLKNVKLELRALTEGYKVQSKFLRCIEKLDEGLTVLIEIYDRIQNYQEQKIQADYLKDLNSPKSLAISVTVDGLREKLLELDFKIKSNIFLGLYERGLQAFKQWAFPFAHLYMEEFKIPDNILNSKTIAELIYRGKTQIENLSFKLQQYSSTVIEGHDQNFIKSEFSSQEPLKPFFVWENSKWNNSINDLLAGKPVIMKADITYSDANKDAIKFTEIELHIKCKIQEKQNDFKTRLEHFQIVMTHLGNSNYRCDNKFYTISSNPLKIEYCFKRNEVGRPICGSGAYEKIKNGDSMLSPYAMWQFQIFKLSSSGSFDFRDLAICKDNVDLELAGNGTFAKSSTDYSLLFLHDYYQPDDTVA